MTDVIYLDINGMDSVPIRCLPKHPETCMIPDILDSTKMIATVPIPSPVIYKFLEAYDIHAEDTEHFYLCLLAALYRGAIDDINLRGTFEVKQGLIWEPVLGVAYSMQEPIWTIYTKTLSLVVVDLFALGE